MGLLVGRSKLIVHGIREFFRVKLIVHGRGSGKGRRSKLIVHGRRSGNKTKLLSIIGGEGCVSRRRSRSRTVKGNGSLEGTRLGNRIVKHQIVRKADRLASIVHGGEVEVG